MLHVVIQWYTFTVLWMKNPKHLKNIFISAIHQNAGKTTLALGLFKNFQERKIKTAFMKPVGQETVTYEEKSIDKDTYLIGEVYHCMKHIKDMSPITVGHGYTEKYILEPQKQQLQDKILEIFSDDYPRQGRYHRRGHRARGGGLGD